MAQTKRKRKSPARKSSGTTRKAKQKIALSKVQTVVLELAALTVLLLVLFRMGAVGAILFGLFNLVFGYMAWLVIIGIMAIILFDLLTLKKSRIPQRYLWGLALFVAAFSMCMALTRMSASEPFGPMKAMIDQASDILTGSLTDPGGLLGDLLAGLFASLFSRTGALLVDISLFIISSLLLYWDLLRSLMAVIMEKEEEGSPAENKPSFFSRIFNGKEENHSDGQAKGRLKPKSKAKSKSQEQPEGQPPLLTFDDDVSMATDRTPDFSSYFDQGVPIDQSQPKEDTGFNFGMEPASPAKKPKKKTKKEKKDEQEKIDAIVETSVDETVRKPADENYQLPSLNLLSAPPGRSRNGANTAFAKESGSKLIEVLDEFGVPAKLGEVHIGPSVTKFEVIPGTGIRVNQILNLQNDIKMALAAKDIRIEAPIPGKSAVGIEVPNMENTTVCMKDLATAMRNQPIKSPLVLCLGKDLLGEAVFGRLEQMPHLLIAGATGSGKSVCMNAIICSFLLRSKPSDVKLVLIDPKKVEFTPYNGIPHLLSPVVTDSDMANKTLKVIVAMMEKRYDLFGEFEVRNINTYNAYVEQHPELHRSKMPRIVVIIDELADLMTTAGKEVESSIQRITQLARAAGIHMIVATQRPSVNVITGVIKANIPCRIAFSVASATDSRTILDGAGAERLLGNGDMLFLDAGAMSPKRVQGVFIRDEEVKAICQAVKDQGLPEYDEAFLTLKDIQTQAQEAKSNDNDPLYDEIRDYVVKTQKASTSNIQRVFSLGYQKAARYMDYLEANGIIGPSRGAKPREVLVKPDHPMDEEEKME